MPDVIIPWPFTRLYDKYPNRIFAKWFTKIAEEIKAKGISGNIVDIGTGPGRLPIEIAKQIKNVNLFGVDISKDMIKLAQKNTDAASLGDRIEFRVGSASDTGFKDNSMDLVLSTNTLHHLSDPVRAFNEIYRLLKPGGEAWVFDGRKDATRTEFLETVRKLDLADDIPVSIISRLWPLIHVGSKTEAYYSGKIAIAIKESSFKKAEITLEGTFMRLRLKKPETTV